MTTKNRPCEKRDVDSLKTLTRRWFNADEYIDGNWNGLDVLLMDERVIGYADCKNDLLDGMLIDFDLHRKGFGSILLSHCENKLFKKYAVLRLECFETSRQANNFYLKNGWKEESRFFDKGNTNQTKILYTKKRPSIDA